MPVKSWFDRFALHMFDLGRIAFRPHTILRAAAGSHLQFGQLKILFGTFALNFCSERDGSLSPFRRNLKCHNSSLPPVLYSATVSLPSPSLPGG